MREQLSILRTLRSRLRRTKSLATIILLLNISSLFAGGVSRTPEPISTGLLFRLKQPAKWSLLDVPLVEAIKFCEKRYRTEIIFDEKSLAKRGITKGVNVKSRGTGTMEEMLTAMLLPIELEWYAEGDTIYIRAQDPNRRLMQNAKASKRLKKQLASVNQYDFSGVTLEKVVVSLSQQHQTPILIDIASLEAAAITTDVELSGSGFKNLRTILTMLLDPVGLTWSANGERILIRAQVGRSESED